MLVLEFRSRLNLMKVYTCPSIACSTDRFIDCTSVASMAASISTDDETSTTALEGAKNYQKCFSGKHGSFDFYRQRD